MRPYHAKRLLEIELKRFHLNKIWGGVLSETYEFCGATYPYLKIICLSVPYIEAHTWEDVHQTILHEIAHALVWEVDDAHGTLWQSTAQMIGVKDIKPKKVVSKEFYEAAKAALPEVYVPKF